MACRRWRYGSGLAALVTLSCTCAAGFRSQSGGLRGQPLASSHSAEKIPVPPGLNPAAEKISQVFSSLSARTIPVPPGIDPAQSKIPVPLIRHFKTAGHGYLHESPLYKIEEAHLLADKRAAAVLPPATAEVGVSTTMRCVIFLTALFFAVYLVFFMLQTLNRLKIVQREREEKCLAAGASTVYFVPMLCILFLAARMRAVQLTKGSTEEYELPQWWVKAAMQTCCYALLGHTLLVYVCTSVYGEMWEAAAKKKSIGSGGTFCVMLRNLVMVCIYMSFTTICFGILVMQPPRDIWGEDGAPSVSPAIMCTILLCIVYFAVYLVSASAKAVNEIGLFGPTLRFSYSQELLKGATVQVLFAPMLCCLFIATRIRALQLNLEHGNPPHWIQMCFYICTASVFAQALLAVVAGALGVSMEEEPPRLSSNDLSIRMGTARATSTAKNVIDALVFITMVCLYAGIASIIIGLHGMHPANSPSPPLPISIQCTLLLTELFFIVYFFIFVIQKLLSSGNTPGGVKFIEDLKVFVGVRAKEAVSFCPMFAVLFLGTFMRALQITRGQGAPQLWCQDWMCVGSGAIFFLTIARVDSLISEEYSGRKILGYSGHDLCTAWQYFCLGILYVSAICIVAALLTMTPENATPVKWAL